MIKVKELTKRFGSFTAVDSISFEVEPGTIFAFLGTNGAGKTTTIRMLTGVLQPTSGSIEIGGFDLQSAPLEAKSIMGVIPDRPYLYGKLAGREFLQFMADLYRVPRGEAQTRMDELLETYGLTDWQNELIDSYSHGMKQRLMMCASQVHRPSLLVVDEPMVGLDPRGAKLLKDTFKKRASEGMTIFMSTHSLSVAQEIADKLAIIRRGKVIAIGTLDDLYNRAKTQETDLEKAFLSIIEESDLEPDMPTSLNKNLINEL